MSSKLLTVNADDFGFTRDVNAGIIEAHRKGILTATTLMANGEAFNDAVGLAHTTPTLDVGCHLVLVGGHSLVSDEPFPDNVPALIKAIVMRKLNPYLEMKLQIKKILGAGLKPLHLDTHKHTHLFPAVLHAVAKLSEEYKIPFVRRPFDFPMRPGKVPVSKQLVSKSFQIVRGKFEHSLQKHGCKSTDFFAGFAITGTYTASDVVELIANLPEGSTEFMCHPGYCTDELRSQKTRLKESRAEELAALVDPQVRQALDHHQVKLVRYADLLA
ncbi:hydrolase [Bryobacterales bacterium F-183]|nr:hydrolase [Bryobacterales bacterium F-183]